MNYMYNTLMSVIVYLLLYVAKLKKKLFCGYYNKYIQGLNC